MLSALKTASSQSATKKRLKALLAFLRDNREYPRHYRRRNLTKLLYLHRSAGSKLTAIFSSAVMSNSSGALEKPGRAVGQFAALVGHMRGPVTTGVECLENFDTTNIDELYWRLQRFPFVGPKKAALFLRDLFETQDMAADSRVFKRRFIKADELRIPFDVVIANVLNMVFKKTMFSSTAALSRHVDDVTKWSHTVSPGDHMVVEDLWYWGYFCLTGSALDRTIQLNEAKVYLDDAFAGLSTPPQHLEAFVQLASGWR